MKAIIANRIAPGLLDRYLAKAGYTGQLSDQPSDPDAPGNLFEPVPGAYGAHGRFDDQTHGKLGDGCQPPSQGRVGGVFIVGVGAHMLAKWLNI